MKQTVEVIFKERPERWGYRGAPYLWDDLEEAFSAVALPCSVWQFLDYFEAFFQDLTLQSFEGESVYVGRYAHGGMSSGQVSIRFWKDTALPLLMTRLELLNNTA